MNQQAKTKRSFPYVALILWVTVALVVLILGYTLVDSIGIIGRMNTDARSNNFELSENHVEVYRSITYNYYYTEFYYEYMYMAYGMQPDTYGVTKMYSSPDAYAAAMLSASEDALEDEVYNTVKQYLTYCEGAKAAGLYDQYKEEVAADVDTYIQNLKDAAENQLVTFKQYMKQNFGNGITEGEIRTAMEYSYISSKYAEKLFDDFSDKVTLEQIEGHVKENKGSFYTTTYTSYPLLVNDKVTFRDGIKACQTADEVKNFLVGYFMEENYDDLYKVNFTDKKVTDSDATKTKNDVRTTLLALNKIGDAEEVFKSTDTDDYKKAAYAIVKAINTDLSKEIAKVKETTSGWVDPEAPTTSNLLKFVFGEGRKEADREMISTTTTKDGKETTTYTWVLIGKDVMKLDTEKTKNAYFIQLSGDKEGTEGALTAEQKADEFVKALEANKTAEKFAELVEKYAPGYSSELAERISEASAKQNNEDLAKWLFDEKGRTKGEITKILVKGDTTNKDKVTGCIIAMYEDENEETWKLNARDTLASEELKKWYDEHVTEYGVDVDHEFTTAPETTASETTTKAPEAGTKAPEAGTEAPETDTAAATETGTEAVTEAATETGAAE